MMKHRRRMLLNLQKENLIKNAIYKSQCTIDVNGKRISGASTVAGVFFIPVTAGTYEITKTQEIGGLFRVGYCNDTSLLTPVYDITNQSSGKLTRIITVPEGYKYICYSGHASSNGDIYEQIKAITTVYKMG